MLSPEGVVAWLGSERGSPAPSVTRRSELARDITNLRCAKSVRTLETFSSIGGSLALTRAGKQIPIETQYYLLNMIRDKRASGLRAVHCSPYSKRKRVPSLAKAMSIGRLNSVEGRKFSM